MKLSFATQGLLLVVLSCSNVFAQGTISSALQEYDEHDPGELVQLANCEQIDFCAPDCAPVKRRSRLSFGAELPLLTAYANHGVATNNWFNDLDSTAAIRATATFDTAGILGFRGRYFHYDANSDSVPRETLQLDLYDIEATTGLDIADWNLVGAAGLRWGSIDFSSGFGRPTEKFDGLGLTMGLDVRRSIAKGVAFYGGVRQSMLYGESVSTGAFIGKLDNVVVPITELRLGADYTRILRSGSRIVAGIGYEHQQLSSLSVRNVGIDPEDVDIALAGPVFSLSWMY